VHETSAPLADIKEYGVCARHGSATARNASRRLPPWCPNLCDAAGTPVSNVTTLAMPAGSGTSMNSCLPFDAQYLRDMPVALSGTATKVDDDGVTLDVDRWYAGGNADVVRLANYDVNTVSLDGFAFEPGSRYLITATDGTVNLCGFSGPWTEDLAAAFDGAFGS